MSLLSLVLILFSTVGCAEWSTSGVIDSSTLARPTESKLPLNRIGNDSIIVDVAFIPLDGPKEIEQLWKAVDETGIPVSARGQLQANGLRAGRLIGQPLDYFNALQESDQPSSPMEALNKAGLASVLSHEQRRMHCHTNQSYSLPTRMAMEGTHSVLLERDGLLTGKSLTSPYCSIEMTPRAQADGTTRIRLLPQVEYGQYRQNWIGQEQAILKKTQRERLELEHLLVEWDLPAGTTCVLGPTDPTVGLGRLLFVGEGATGNQEQTVLLIRATAQHGQLMPQNPLPTR